MEKWKEYVQAVAEAMGTSAVDLPDIGAMVVLSVNPIHVRIGADGKTLAIEARLLPLMHGIPADGTTLDELAKIGGQIAGAIRPGTECFRETDGDNLIASLVLPFKDDDDGTLAFAEGLSNLSQMQQKMSDFLSGEMTEEAMDKIMKDNQVNRLAQGRSLEDIAEDTDRLADEAERLLKELE